MAYLEFVYQYSDWVELVLRNLTFHDEGKGLLPMTGGEEGGAQGEGSNGRSKNVVVIVILRGSSLQFKSASLRIMSKSNSLRAYTA